MRLSFRDGPPTMMFSSEAPSTAIPNPEAIGVPAPMWGGGDSEHVATFVPPWKRHPNGGAYVTQQTASGFHVGFLPGGSLPSSAISGVAPTRDGHRLRAQDINPDAVKMNARARVFYRIG